MNPVFSHLEYFIFAVGVLAVLVVLALMQRSVSRTGKPGRITWSDWLLVAVGLIGGFFCVNLAADWQRARINEIARVLNPAQANMIENSTQENHVLEPIAQADAESDSALADPRISGIPPHDPAGFESPARTPSAPWLFGFVPTSDADGRLKALLDITSFRERRTQSVQATRRLTTGIIAAVFLAIGGIILYFRVREEHIESKVESAHALAQSEARFRHLFEGSPDAILVCDADGIVQNVNPRLSELLQFSKNALVGRKFGDLADAESKTRIEDELRISAVGLLERFDNISLATESGGRIPVEVCSRGIRYQDEEHLLLHVRDVSERLKLENELRQAQKMQGIGQLAAGVAHDFNNLLTVIQGHTTMLVESHAGESRSTDSLAEIAAATGRAAELTRHLLTFSRKQQMRPENLDGNAAVTDMVKFLGRLIPEHIQLRVTAKAAHSVVRADRGMLEQVVTNLVINAQDAMPSGGQLEVVTDNVQLGESEVHENPRARIGRFWVLSVRDTGTGMNESVLSRIFEPFFTTKDVGKGTGLGLASVYGIVAQHNGWIDVKSAPGLGSVFRVFIPESNQPATTAKSAGHLSEIVEGGSETILIVEDEPALRELAVLNLNRYGYNVIKASSGLEAMKLWDEIAEEVDIVVTDMVMPDGISGLELGKRLKAIRPGLPIVYMSGYTGNIIGMGVDDDTECTILQKPYAPKALAQRIRTALDAACVKSA